MQETNATTAGKSIVSYLESRGIRQTWLAGQLRLSPSSLNRYLHGTEGYRLTRVLVEAAADSLDVPAVTRREWLSLLTTSDRTAA